VEIRQRAGRRHVADAARVALQVMFGFLMIGERFFKRPDSESGLRSCHTEACPLAACEQSLKWWVVQFELPDAKWSLIESLSLISLRLDGRQKTPRVCEGGAASFTPRCDDVSAFDH
jgi:hypothetical protein